MAHKFRDKVNAVFDDILGATFFEGLMQGTLYTRQYVHCQSRSVLVFLAAAGLK